MATNYYIHMPKYRDFFRQMIDQHNEMFTEFKDVHDRYEQDQQKYQDEYNDKGKNIVEIIRKQESLLCGNMEKGENAKYSSRLSEKFWGEVRAFFPMIDYVGAQVS